MSAAAALAVAPNEALFERADFPILGRTMRGGQQLVYLDSGATAQKPQRVMDAVIRQELELNGAVARGSHELAEASTLAYEDARANIAAFIGAQPSELVFTKNSTEALNEVAYSLGNIAAGRAIPGTSPDLLARLTIRPGDNIVVTRLEHHANLVPWQELAARTGAQLRWLEITADGRLDLASAEHVLDKRTKVFAFTHVSNVTGAVTPVAQLVALARHLDDGGAGPLIVLDSCQSVPHMPLDVKALDVDFAVLSGHKMYGPTGAGALYGKRELLQALPPFLTGGSMIEIVKMDHTTYADPPARFEAGSQPVAQVVGLSAAVDYLRAVGMERVAAYEQQLTAYLLEHIVQIPGVKLLGPADPADRLGAVAFDLEGVHPHDVGQVLDNSGIAVRVGHHCAQPIHQFYGVWASTRVTLAPYNTRDELDKFLEALSGVRKFFGL